MRPGDIHWVELPPTGGREQSGRRPAVTLQDDDYAGNLPLVIVIPLTSATSASRFAGTLLSEPTAANGLRTASVALVFQVCAVDRHTVREKLGTVDEAKLMKIYSFLGQLTGRAART